VTPSSAQGSSSRSNSEYADVADMFRELEELPEASAQFQRQRDRIVERCLPLADHIAATIWCRWPASVWSTR
jgi:RNA polymerase sigma-B factor